MPSAGQNRKVPVFGALDALTGKATVLLTEKKRAGDFLGFVLFLIGRHPGKHLFLFLDNCSIHTAKVVQRVLADLTDRVTLIWNAPYTPELNLIERYWGHLKGTATHNYFFETIERLEEAIHQAVISLNRKRSRRMAITLDMLRSFREAA